MFVEDVEEREAGRYGMAAPVDAIGRTRVAAKTVACRGVFMDVR